MTACAKATTAALGLALLLLGQHPASAAETCTEIYARSQSLGSGGAPDQWKVLFEAATAAADCDEAFRRALGRKTAVAIYNDVQARLSAGAGAAELEEPLNESLTYFHLWQPLAMLGDMHRENRHYPQAARRYEDALQTIADEELTPTAPPSETIAAIFHKAEETRLLAGQYIVSTRSRSGEPAGLAARSIRGFVPTKVAIPVTFEYNSDALTSDGLAAAKDMVEYLKAQGAGGITVIGHTDPRGSEGYNLALSESRARALASYLKENGYPGTVNTIGKGESEPFIPDDPGRYSDEQRWQMDRRVDLQRGP